MSVRDPVDHLVNEFQRVFGEKPLFTVSSPGRVDLMGSHTDYNHGYVLTLPINRFTWIAARPRQDRLVRLYSLTMDDNTTFSLDRLERDRAHPWANYVLGVASVFQEEGLALNGFDGLIHSTVPVGSGLSSSAALEVATARLFQALGNYEINPVRLAILCQRAENHFVGMNCGILDQFTASVGQIGRALMLDCRLLTGEQVHIHPEIAVVICDTRARRQLTGSEYPERRAQCEQGASILASYLSGVTHLRDVSKEGYLALSSHLPPLVARRCQFIIEENQRVLDISQVLPTGEQEMIARLTASSFIGARDLYEIVSPEMELMMAAMLSAPGIIGARQAGAGFGGCMVAFVRTGRLEAFASHVQNNYQQTAGIQARIFSVTGAPHE